MIYGLYLSAAGVLTNSYRQDVIANNIANAETTGFKKDLALFQQRPTEAAERGGAAMNATNAMLEHLGGGIFASPSQVDVSQGELEASDRNLDVALEGPGYFTVSDKGTQRLTRDGRFQIDRDGHLILSNGQGQQVLDAKGQPIVLDPTLAQDKTLVSRTGDVTQGGKLVARLGVVDVDDPTKLQKLGGNLISYPDAAALRPSDALIRSNATERANVEPATELTQLMDAQRQLEANANMIRYQDSTLQRLVNDVGKIS